MFHSPEKRNKSVGNEENVFVGDWILTPPIAVAIFIAACLSGHRFRRVWRAEGPTWQLWCWGLLAAAGLLILGFTPLRVE